MTEERPRLLFLSPLPPPSGGISNWMRQVRDGPLSERFAIRVVDSSPGGDAVSGTSRLRPARALGAFAILLRFVVELVRFRPRVVHVNTSYFWAFLRDGLAIWLAAGLGARTVLHFRGGDFPEFAEGTSGLLRRALLATLRRADRLVALTQHTERYLVGVAGAERVRYVPNFVRPEALGPVAAPRPGAPVHVLFVGWLLEAKGVRELLAAARALPALRFTLVGPEDPAFVASIRGELDALGERVRLLPTMPPDEVLALYRTADIFALPTHREGFPNVVLEAMAAGLPVVATRVGAIPEAVRDGEEGLLVPPRDAQALTDALSRLAGEPELRARMARQARRRAEEVFALPVVLGALEAIYREFVEPGRA